LKNINPKYRQAGGDPDELFMNMTLKETIRYVSTRRVSSTSTTNNTNADSVTFEEAILQGYAPDGGLFVSERLPTISTQELLLWASFSYTQLTFQVLRKFISLDEIPDDALLQICTEAFQKDWYHKDVIPVIPLITSAVVDDEEEEEGSSSSQDNNNNHNNNTNILYVSELFHGPTHCFKDLGMIMMILLLQYFATKRQKTITLLVSTTGDTGPAAVHAVRRLTGSSTASWNTDNNNAEDTSPIKVIVHYPKGQISKFQRLQLTTQICYPQVTVVSFEGGGDDMDVPIKNILTEQRQKPNNNNNDDECNQHCCTGVNSYNIARPIMQAVHYVSNTTLFS
jgi:threonine synthase